MLAGDAPDGGQPALGARRDAARLRHCPAPSAWPPPTARPPTIADEDVAVCAAIGDHGADADRGYRRAAERRASRQRAHPLQRRLARHRRLGHRARADLSRRTTRGIPVHVWVDETRPRNQGASLTAWELNKHGVPHTVIADNTGGHLMQHGMVDLCIVGTDRTTRDRRRRQQDRHVPEGARRARQQRAVLRRPALVDDRLARSATACRRSRSRSVAPKR